MSCRDYTNGASLSAQCNDTEGEVTKMKMSITCNQLIGMHQRVGPTNHEGESGENTYVHIELVQTTQMWSVRVCTYMCVCMCDRTVH